MLLVYVNVWNVWYKLRISYCETHMIPFQFDSPIQLVLPLWFHPLISEPFVQFCPSVASAFLSNTFPAISSHCDFPTLLLTHHCACRTCTSYLYSTVLVHSDRGRNRKKFPSSSLWYWCHVAGIARIPSSWWCQRDESRPSLPELSFLPSKRGKKGEEEPLGMPKNVHDKRGFSQNSSPSLCCTTTLVSKWFLCELADMFVS